ncbi:MAG: 1-acyl-sn-glycerol-3-phosphate acyltransferase [Eubacteriales bacterium]|nr:1-acyl-sn-glycerol-3-phosphate acyltransferase [Eubacteriales bacterium]
MKEDKNQWIKSRHKILTFLFRPLLFLLSKLLYHIKIDKFSDPDHRPYLILANHQTDFDQFFIASAFDRPVYYVAMEDIFSMGFVSKIIRWCVAPIPINKASTDIKSVMTCMRVAKQGGTIAIFPEGNRTYSGKTCYIKPAIAALAKSLKLPIAIFRIEGGYGVKPRWASRRRGGTMKAGVRRVIEPEEYKTMTNEELFDIISKELYVDDSTVKTSFPSQHSAEYIERVLFVCPDCGLSEFRSSGNTFTCEKCGKKWNYLPDLTIQSEKGPSPFKNASEWYNFQEQYIRDLDLSAYLDTPAYREKVSLYETIVYQKKIPLYLNSEVSLYGDRIEISAPDSQVILLFDDIKAMACIADHKLNIFYKDKLYQLRGDPRFNALKYCNLYYHAKYLKEHVNDGEFQFLGL